jgi:hypothetical protein
MRRHNPQQRRCHLGKIVVDAEMHARRHKGERLQQAFHMRIVAAVGLKQKPACHARILFGELTPKLAQVRQFAFVIFQQFFAHRSLHFIFAA